MAKKKREAKPVVLYQTQLQDDGTIGFYTEEFPDETDSHFVRKNSWRRDGREKVSKEEVSCSANGKDRRTRLGKTVSRPRLADL